MKTIKYLLFMTMASLFVCYSCTKVEDYATMNAGQNDLVYKSTLQGQLAKPWIENFTTASSLEYNWILYGDPKPEWVNAAFGKLGLFDNKGPSPTKNFAVSRQMVGNGEGYIVESEVLLKILRPGGTCVCPGIAISREPNPSMKNGEIENGITLRLIYAGERATWFPPSMIGHAWFVMAYITEQETIEAKLIKNADEYCNFWHKLRFVVSPSREIRFYCDQNLLWSPSEKVNPMLMTDKNVVLGYTSDGNDATNAGIAYHNWVKVSYPIAGPNPH